MISIIIPVKNDKRIEKTLKKLEKIPKPEKTEILVVDASEGKLDAIKKKFPTVRWVYFYNKTDKNYTLPEQRNLGLKKARGDLIAFIDADCIPTQNWLINLTKPIREEGEDYVTGLVKPLGGPSVYDIEWEKAAKRKYRNVAGTANTIFKRKILSEVGYFDEDFEYGEDSDFTWRVIDAGYKIRYNKEAVIFDYFGNLKQRIRRSINYGIARVRLYKKHPDKWRNLFGYSADTWIYPVYILLLPITFFWPYYLLFLLIPLTRNLLTKSLRKKPIEKIFLDLIFGLGVLKELFFPKKD